LAFVVSFSELEFVSLVPGFKRARGWISLFGIYEDFLLDRHDIGPARVDTVLKCFCSLMEVDFEAVKALKIKAISALATT